VTFVCPKCKATSGNDWSQCRGACPMPMSPHHGRASCAPLDVDALRDEFHCARMIASQRARWDASDPGAPPNTCRYCGKHWRRWVGSKLDGHAACIVTDDFKRRVGVLLRSPTVTYEAIGRAIDVTPAVVRSWTFPIRSNA
jgi:hypothetical protein